MRPCPLARPRHKHNWPTITPFKLTAKLPSTGYLLQSSQRVKARFRGCPLPPLSPHPQILQHHVHYKTNHAPINDRQETIHQVPSPASWQKTSPKKHTHQIPIKYPTYLHTSYYKKQSTTSQAGSTMETCWRNLLAHLATHKLVLLLTLVLIGPTRPNRWLE